MWTAYHFAADWFSIHVSGRRGQGFPVSSFVVSDKSCHFTINLLIGQENSFDSTYLENKINLQLLICKKNLNLLKFSICSVCSTGNNVAESLFFLSHHSQAHSVIRTICPHFNYLRIFTKCSHV